MSKSNFKTRHESLLQHKEAGDDVLAQVTTYIEQMRQESQKIASPQERDQLRSILRYWSNYVYSETNTYPKTELLPVLPEYEAAFRQQHIVRRLRTLIMVGITTVMLILLGVRFLFKAQANRLEDLNAQATYIAAIAARTTAEANSTRALANQMTAIAAQASAESNLATRSATTTFTLTLIPSPTPTFTSLWTPTPSPTLTSTPSPMPTSTPVLIPILPSVVSDLEPVTFLQAHRGPILQVVYNPTTDELLSVGADGVVLLWGLRSQSRVIVDEQNEWIQSAAIRNDGRLIAYGGNDRVITLSTTTGEIYARFTGHEGFVFSVVFHPDGVVFASGSGDGTVRIWDVITGEQLIIIQTNGTVVYEVAFSPDGRLLAVANSDDGASIWSAASGDLLCTYEGVSALSLAFTPNSQVLAVGGKDGKLAFIFSDNCQPIKSLIGHSDNVNGLAFSPDGAILTSGSKDGTVKVWSLEQGTLLNSLEAHSGSVETVAFSPDGITFASGDTNGTIIIWGVEEK